MSDNEDARDEGSLEARVLAMSAEVWESKVTKTDLERWLANFRGRALRQEDERIEALHLLSHFVYFGEMEVRQLLVALYRDLFRYVLVQEVRDAHGGTRDRTLIEASYRAELDRTRFLGLGGPSESGHHLLYFFRQENALPPNRFVSKNDLFDGPASSQSRKFNPIDLKRIVFIDDVLGSGSQAATHGRQFVAEVKALGTKLGQSVEVWYLVLFAKERGLDVARRAGFDRVAAVHELDASQEAFHRDSFAFADDEWRPTRGRSARMARVYGSGLFPGHPLGFDRGQLMLGLHHNTPDNTLPIFWNNERDANWHAVFPRHPKDE